MLIAFAPLAAFWPINKLSRSQLAVYIVCSFWMGMDVLYFGAQIPWLNFSTFFFLSFQTLRSVAIAAVVIAMTLLLIHRIRKTNREHAALAADSVRRRRSSGSWFHSELRAHPACRSRRSSCLRRRWAAISRFRVLEDGAQWMLLGDVSGKGAAAV